MNPLAVTTFSSITVLFSMEFGRLELMNPHGVPANAAATAWQESSLEFVQPYCRGGAGIEDVPRTSLLGDSI